MPRKTPARRRRGPPTVHVLRVTLDDIDPPVWREVRVPSETKLELVHYAIQEAFPWANSHLHLFEAGSRRVGQPSPDDDSDVQNERRVAVANVLLTAGAKITYEYDFGDGWRHEVRAVEVRPPAAGEGKSFACLGGARACPTEGCGGPSGYEELVAALADSAHKRHTELTEWLAWCRGMGYDDVRYMSPFDPERFFIRAADSNVRAVGRELRQ